MGDLEAYYQILLDRFGHQNWWPAESPFEMMIGAILTQNTAWTGVEKAISNLKKENVLNPRSLANLEPEKVATLIRPAGYFNQKTKRIQAFTRWFLERFEGKIERMQDVPFLEMREELLALNGIGPETADSILLYALKHPTFVIDTYTYRMLHRHGFIGEESSYEEMKTVMEEQLPKEEALFNDFHAQIVRVGKEYCRKNPKCEECPLKSLLP
ncbi:MAG: endonuclease III domain-containing protein [Planctomycetota bacterium]|nr:endonuclease III domain-containing protein [Planctomycetota bacterium]